MKRHISLLLVLSLWLRFSISPDYAYASIPACLQSAHRISGEEAIPQAPTAEATRRIAQVRERIQTAFGEPTFLGEGAQSIVLAVRLERRVGDLAAGTEVVIKIPRREASKGDFEKQAKAEKEFYEAVAAEPSTRALLRNFARVHQVGNLEGTPYVVAERVSGVPLSQALLLGTLGPQTHSTVIIEGMRSIAGALLTLHTQRKVHLDVKPGNIMVERVPGSERLVWRLTDLGLMTDIGANQPGGTPRYMHPARRRASYKAHPRDDLHALGVTLREILAATEPPERTLIPAEALATREALERFDADQRREALGRQHLRTLADRLVNLEITDAATLVRALE